MNPAERRLAVMVSDHPLVYAEFEGIIPEGSYGAGPVVIWDTGTYVPLAGDPRDGIKTKKRDAHADPQWKLKTALTPQKLKSLEVRIPPCETE